MPHLDLRDTPVGPRYFLDDVLLVDEDAIEIRPVLRTGGWIRGLFFSNLDPSASPWIQCARYGHRLSDSDELRWASTSPLESSLPLESRPPLVSPATEASNAA
jgi:hypothetical protein